MSGHPDLISVIVSTYNWPKALGLVLDSLATQVDRGFEVVVADDGSTPETGNLVAARARDFPVPLRHVWQEDQGFRAAAARNRAVVESRGDYLLFLDGDCLVRDNFVRVHRRLACPGWFVAGNCIQMGVTLTATVLAGGRPIQHYTWLEFLVARRCGEVDRLTSLLCLPGGYFRKLRPRRWQGVLTRNLGLWREDYFLVNGFDENFVGWGHEDAEFVGRLINAGIFRKDGCCAVPVLHFWHASPHRGREVGNLRRMQQQLANKVTRAEMGVDRYSL